MSAKKSPFVGFGLPTISSSGRVPSARTLAGIPKNAASRNIIVIARDTTLFILMFFIITYLLFVYPTYSKQSPSWLPRYPA